jgi:hypothetical protein
MRALKYTQVAGSSFQPARAPGAQARFTDTGAIMKTTSKIIATVAATLALATAGAVLAQPGYGPGMGYGPGGGGMGYGPGMGGGPGMGPGAMGGMGQGRGMGGGGYDTPAVAAARMADLKAQLKITSGQEAAWKTYETAVTNQASTMQAMRTQFQAQAQNAQSGAANPDLASQRLTMMAQHDAARASQSAALRDLYAVLTPEQRTSMGNLHMVGGGPRGPGRNR